MPLLDDLRKGCELAGFWVFSWQLLHGPSDTYRPFLALLCLLNWGSGIRSTTGIPSSPDQSQLQATDEPGTYDVSCFNLKYSRPLQSLLA
jgi:hypothetical protein